MKVAYIGNFGAPQSTETHIARALENNGHEVERLQEGQYKWRRIADVPCDFILWTTTYDYAAPPTFEEQRRFLARRDVPVVGYHLDRWWGLDREPRIFESPFFQVDLLCTADGGHDELWEKQGIDHVWFPPAVSRDEAQLGTPRDEYRSEVGFVGSWDGYGHGEWAHRMELVDWLRATYKDRVKFWPPKGQHAIRGIPLRDLYASIDVVVGDSCLAGDQTRYWSDRVPETLGRGGFLVHPEVEGLADQFPMLPTWPVGDWAALRELIDECILAPVTRAVSAEVQRAHVLRHHTYEVRMEQLMATMSERGLL